MPDQIVIVGGGPAGVATAIALRDRGFGVVLVEQSNYDTARVGEHLVPDARPLLAELGLLDDVARGGHLPSPGVRSAWGGSTLESKSYIFSPHGGAWNLSRPSFDASLAARAEARGATVLRGTRLQSLHRQGGKWALELHQGTVKSIRTADFLVDSTGRGARVAGMLGCRRTSFDKLLAVVAVYSPRSSETNIDSTVLLEAQQDGWWYGMALPDGRIAAALMTDADLLHDSGRRPIDYWRRRLEQSTHMKAQFGACKLAASVHVCSARSERLTSTVGPDWLAVGDAAGSFDPLSSSGILKGLAGGIRAAKAIESHFAGDTESLERYQTEVRQAFDDYLASRAQFYRMENRWPESTFWKRRHGPVLSETPVTLDPSVKIRSRTGVSSRTWQSALDETVPGLDGALLLRLAQHLRPAHRLISQFRSRSKSFHSDRELIVAVQVLRDRGLLHVN